MNKYRAKKTVVDGITFDSKKEAKRYQELKLAERAGQITDLVLQPKFDLVINGIKCGFYKADFEYTCFDSHHVVEDCKGFLTPIYRLKKKMIKAIYGIEIFET